ncbi:ATP-binding cassette domain-containing protein [Oerskovia sp. M15]
MASLASMTASSTTNSTTPAARTPQHSASTGPGTSPVLLPIETEPFPGSHGAAAVPDVRPVAVSVQGVYKVFGRRPQEAVRRLKDGASRADVKSLGTAAVIDASFDVRKGEIFVVMGLSGSGKSTLIRMLNGLWKPTAATSWWATPTSGTSAPAAARPAPQPREHGVPALRPAPHRTVLDNAAYPSRSRA